MNWYKISAYEGAAMDRSSTHRRPGWLVPCLLSFCWACCEGKSSIILLRSGRNDSLVQVYPFPRFFFLLSLDLFGSWKMLPIAFLPPPLLYLEAPTWSRRFAMCKLVRGASIYSKGREKEQWDGVGPIGTASMEISKSVVGFVENWERGGPGQSPPLPFRMERVKTTEFFFFFFSIKTTRVQFFCCCALLMRLLCGGRERILMMCKEQELYQNWCN